MTGSSRAGTGDASFSTLRQEGVQTGSCGGSSAACIILRKSTGARATSLKTLSFSSSRIRNPGNVFLHNPPELNQNVSSACRVSLGLFQTWNRPLSTRRFYMKLDYYSWHTRASFLQAFTNTTCESPAIAHPPQTHLRSISSQHHLLLVDEK